ncbi:MAG: response regulator [Candidatus Cloacimonetes bacterium]|nr:response regulator [Candidatus Cloacimonadota bacterium]
MNKSESILIIDDELPIRRLLEISLNAAEFKVFQSKCAKDGIIDVASQNPDLVLLDLGLPDMDGIDVLKSLREWFFKPIIILSVRSQEDDIIAALDAGANDYITKPFRTGELLARIRVAIRSSQKKEKEPVIFVRNLMVDLINHIVKKDNNIVKLTSTEFLLLSLFVKNQGRVLTHQFLLKNVWGYSYMEQTQYLRVFIASIRKKIENNPTKPELLITESGIGYRFAD